MNQRYLATVREVIKAPCDITEIESNLNGSLQIHDQFAADCSYNSFLTLLNRQDYLIGDYTMHASPVVTSEQRENIIEIITDLVKKKSTNLKHSAPLLVSLIVTSVELLKTLKQFKATF